MEAGFSLHAGVVAQHWEREKLERLCRYITRPPISEKRLSVTPTGNVRYQLKTPYRDGTTHVVFEPLDFLSKLAALALRGPTETESKSDSIPRCLCSQQQISIGSDASPARQEIRAIRQNTGGKAAVNELGPKIKTSFQH